MAKAAANAKSSGGKKALTKTQFISNISEASEVAKKDVAKVFDALAEEIKKQLGGKGPGVIQIPGLIKIAKKKMPARPAQKNVLNRLTGQYSDRPARPAYNKVVVRALKNLKGMA